MKPRKSGSPRRPTPPTPPGPSAERVGVGIAPAVALSARPTPGLPVVGVGASAGGLEAIGQFLKAVAPASGMAYVIVQHLDPTHAGVLPELLRHSTSMPVVQVTHRLRVEPDSVYVIPPNTEMTLQDGRLLLRSPSVPRGCRLPIDGFFASLALDHQERGIAVILSGMGSDGTIGARAIKEQAGIVAVQDPGTARFDAMPRSVIDAGLADIVAAPSLLPDRIAVLLRRVPPRVPPESDAPSEEAFGKALRLLRARTGHDFSLYKRNTLRRRIERRMGVHRIQSLGAYGKHLEANPQELDLLFRELLIGVTRFFRDAPAWEQLGLQTLPSLLAARAAGETFRAWLPGCSTGEEAYSLAISFVEARERSSSPTKAALQIFATDLDADAIGLARRGHYPASIAADVSPERLARFFSRENHGYRLRSEIREMVIFAQQNLIRDPPFTRLDILCCRNLLIYLMADVQRKLIPLFHFCLRPGGILFLGSAEAIGEGVELFLPLPGKSQLFQRTESSSRLERLEFPGSFSDASSPGAAPAAPAARTEPSLQSAADQLMLGSHAPPAVLINENGDILYISGRTGKYLEPAAGKANWNLFAMARSGLRQELGGAIRSALRQDERILLPGLNIDAETGPVRVDVTLEHHKETGPLHGLILIVFRDQPPLPLPLSPPPGARTRSRSVRLVELEEAIQRVRAQSRSANEEMQLSQEELRSTNEELQSTNEELQSANEELTTSKEEMQSMNEELQTLNAELQAKVDELSRASSDMKNLLDSTDIATLFLDRKLRVRRFTPEATRIIRLIPTDIGRPITDLASPLDYPALATDADQVLRTLAPTEKPITSRDGRWFTVRIMAYRTLDDRIDGLVITFADITESKKLESRLRRGRKQGPAEPGADSGETSLESPPKTTVRKHPLRP